MVKEVIGDLLVMADGGYFDVICHGANCHCTMNSGIAKSIRAKYPEAYEVDCETTPGDKNKLGTITYTKKQINPVVVNCYTQFNYGKDFKVYADYMGIEKSLQAVKDTFPGKRIGLPKIGAGLARGDWNIIKGIIEKVFNDPADDVTIVVFEGDSNDKKDSASAQLFNVFKSKTSNSSNKTTPQSASSNITDSITPTPTSVTSTTTKPTKVKKPHGKRVCRKCHVEHSVSDMIRILPAIWVCKEICLKEFVKIADEIYLSIYPPIITTPTTTVIA